MLVGLHGAGSAVAVGIPMDNCRVAPYVSLQAMRLAMDHQHHAHTTTTSQQHSPPPPSLPPVPFSTSRHLGSIDPALAAALSGLQSAAPFLPAGSPLMAAAAAAAAAGSMLFYPTPMHYGLSLQAALRSSAATDISTTSVTGVGSATAALSLTSKNSSIADLRLKAKKYAAALGLGLGLGLSWRH